MQLQLSHSLTQEPNLMAKSKKQSSEVTLQFLGAAETVTGSKYLLKGGGKQVLIDCGLFQGLKKLRLLNRTPPAFDARELDAVILTHAHLDHVGYLPVLVKQGFKGPVYCTEPTAELAEIILRDSARLQEEEARLANERGFTLHDPAEPLYYLKDVERTLPLLRKLPLTVWKKLDDRFLFRFRPVGHVLGAAFIELEVDDLKVVFSGDIGRRDDLLLYQPERPLHPDVLVMESTYGDRLHPDRNDAQQLAQIIARTWREGGTVIIPSFALERAQMLMYQLWQLQLHHQLPPVPLYMDSPMGAAVMRVFDRYHDWHKLSQHDIDQLLRTVTQVEDYRVSQALVADPRPKVVIASSGMITGGRVLSYLERYLDQPNCCVVLAGYQAEGTRGRQLQEGAQELKIRGQFIPVRARVERLASVSSHADQNGLLDRVALLQKAPRHVFLTHGEPHAADALRVKLKAKLRWNAVIPALHDVYDVSS